MTGLELLSTPDEFIIPRLVEDEFGVVHEYDDVTSGEAWEGGPLLISWHDAQMAGDGYNVVIHEFAHKLDMLNGEADGIPPLHAGMSRQVWSETLHAAFEDFCQLVDVAEDYGRETLLDPYGAEHPGEFFAVMSEAFFESPELYVLNTRNSTHSSLSFTDKTPCQKHAENKNIRWPASPAGHTRLASERAP